MSYQREAKRIKRTMTLIIISCLVVFIVGLYVSFTASKKINLKEPTTTQMIMKEIDFDNFQNVSKSVRKPENAKEIKKACDKQAFFLICYLLTWRHAHAQLLSTNAEFAL